MLNSGAVCYDARVRVFENLATANAQLTLNLSRVMSIAVEHGKFLLTANMVRNLTLLAIANEGKSKMPSGLSGVKS